MAQTKPKAAQFYGVSNNGTAGQVLISDGNGGMSWGANTEQFTVSWATPTGQSLTYTQPNPQSSAGTPGVSFPTTTFTVTKSSAILSGTATIANLPTGITATQVITGSGVGNTLTVTLAGVFPSADSLNTALIISGLTVSKTVSWATPTGQSLTYTQPSPQSSIGNSGTAFPTTTFTATKSGEVISGTATIAGLPTGITASQSISGSGSGNVLTITLAGVFPGADSLNTALTISGLTIAAPAYTVNYLVVAGGGSGSGFYRAGGGGAGGLRTSYGSNSGGGGNSETPITFSAATNYTVTVGAGGTGASNTEGANGSNSVFSTVTSIGGGKGGRYTSTTGTPGTSGGSGGGGGGDATGGAGGAGTASQGYAGGSGASSNVQCGGGGGGAGVVGKTGGNGATDGDGGDGIESTILNYANSGTASVGEQISGSQVWYGGGGGGGSYASANNTTPGKGGGGEGTNSSTYPGNGGPGDNNTGGGGGGASGETSPGSGIGGSGGSGVVIIRYPSSYTVSGLAEATGSPFTEGSNKVSVFTSGTGNIQFN